VLPSVVYLLIHIFFYLSTDPKGPDCPEVVEGLVGALSGQPNGEDALRLMGCNRKACKEQLSHH
jgi:hypothetical protein